MVRPVRSLIDFLYRIVLAREFSILIAIITIGLCFTLSSPHFLTYDNFLIIGRLTAYVAIVAIGMTLLLSSGAFDLSVGSIFALSSVSMALLVIHTGISLWLLPLISLIIGVACGFVNGFITTKLRLPAFIVTLGTLFLYRSLALILSKGWPVTFNQSSEFRNAFGGDILGISTPILWMVILTIIFSFILSKTRYGNRSLATGGGELAAIAAGINTRRVKTINFMILGALASLNGLIQMSRMQGVYPVQGEGLEFESIGAAVVGGTSLFGGSATVIGTVCGAFLIAMVKNGLALMGVSAFYYGGLLGLIVIMAVIIGRLVERRRR